MCANSTKKTALRSFYKIIVVHESWKGGKSKELCRDSVLVWPATIIRVTCFNTFFPVGHGRLQHIAASNCSVICFYQPNIHHSDMSGNEHLPLQITKPITFPIDFVHWSVGSPAMDEKLIFFVDANTHQIDSANLYQSISSIYMPIFVECKMCRTETM